MKVITFRAKKEICIHDGLLKGESTTLLYLKKHYFRMFLSLVKKMGSRNSGEDAEDLYSETLVELLVILQSGKVRIETSDRQEPVVMNIHSGKSSLLGTYLYGIARNKWTRSNLNPLINRESANEEPGLSDTGADDHGVPAFCNDGEKNERYRERFSHLNPRCRMMLLLKTGAGLDHVLIAGLLGISHGSARNLLSRCMKALTDHNQRQSPPVERSKHTLTLPWHELYENTMKDERPPPGDEWIETKLIERYLLNDLDRELCEKIESKVSASDTFRQRIELQRSVLSYLHEKISGNLKLYREDKASAGEFNERNDRYDQVFETLESRCRIMLLLYFCLNEKMEDISEMMEFDDDISAEKGIYKCKSGFIERIATTMKAKK